MERVTRDGSSDPATDLDGPEPPRGRPSEVLRLASAPRIPGYRIDGLIGRGTTGTVYRAVQLAVEREVALKVLHPELAQRPQVVQRLQREARTMARLAHPHVVGAIDMGQVDGRWWFAMELVDGPSLAQHLRTHGPLSEREALRLFAPLCEALEHLSEHGVVHRDVKPANILLERAGRGETQHLRARLADLGLAVGERDPSLTVHGGTLGTPHYISPEQSRDPRDVDVRSDLWALGATLFHAVCGRPPFEGDSAAEVLSAVLHQPVPDPRRIVPRLSPGLALVVRKCLVRDPARRYQSPAELLADLERLRERRTPLVQRRDLDPLERDPRPWRRPTPWLVAAFVVAAGLAVHFALQPAGPPGPAARGDGAAEAVLAPLRERVESAEGEPRLWLDVLAEIEAARDAASGVGGGEAWLELRRRASAGLEGELTQLRGGLTTRVDQALAQRDLVAARAELERFDTALVARLGVDVAALPLDLLLATERRVAALSARVDAQLEERRADGARRIQEHEATVVVPRVEALVEQERWRDARAILVAAPDRILAEAGLDVRGLPRDAQDELVAGVLEGRAVRRSELDRAWVLRQRGLGERLELEAEALGRFEWPAVPPDPAAALPAALEAELARLGLAREQAPDGAVLAVDLALPELVARTRTRLSAALERAARDEFELRRGVVAASLAARRRFGELADQWAEFARRCDAVPTALAPGGFASELAAEARMLEHEGRRLERTLAAAADAVVALAGREASFEVAPRLSVTGTVTTSADPLANGFSVVVRERPYVLVLRPERSSRRCVVLDDLVELAGLGGELTPDQRLDLVCLRWHAGDRDGARSAVLGGPLPTDGLAARLSERMPARLLGAAPTGAAPGDVVQLLELALGPLQQRDPHLSAGIADVLLEQHVDDERVALAAERLRAVRAR
jgi:serine/threonine-protein kinase